MRASPLKHSVGQAATSSHRFGSCARATEGGGSAGITVTYDFDSIEAARAFAGADELKAAMQALGVVEHPEIWFAERV